MKLLILLMVAAFSIFTGQPAKNAQVFIQDNRTKETVAFQTAGEKGKVEFSYLKEGSYKLLIGFPQQEGKYIKTKAKYITLTKATYNIDAKTYYYQGQEGFFSVKFKGNNRIDTDNLKVIFEEVKTDKKDELLIGMVEFVVRKNGATINVAIKALTAKEYKKATDKLSKDISTISIPTIN